MIVQLVWHTTRFIHNYIHVYSIKVKQNDCGSIVSCRVCELMYSRKYWRGIIFGRLADFLSHRQYILNPPILRQPRRLLEKAWQSYCNRQIYIRQLQFFPFFKQSAKHYSHQYIRLYGSTNNRGSPLPLIRGWGVNGALFITEGTPFRTDGKGIFTPAHLE